jgi:quercetin dioxygenase-like cupin family protein
MRPRVIIALLGAILIGLGFFYLDFSSDSNSAEVVNSAQPSEIKSEADIAVDAAPWGDFYAYFTEDTKALKPVLVGVAKIDAGKQIHPPHRHADEEYLMITKGEGTWHLNGVESPAKEGDILYSAPWDYHGVKASDDSPLEFVVFKYSARDSAVPVDPNPNLPEELAE